MPKMSPIVKAITRTESSSNVWDRWKHFRLEQLSTFVVVGYAFVLFRRPFARTRVPNT